MPGSENPVRTKQAEPDSATTDERGQAAATARGAQGIYLALLNATEQGFCTIEMKFDDAQRPVDYLFLEVNPSFERQTGIQNAVGRWMREISPDQDQYWYDLYGRVALTGNPERLENFSTALDRWFSVYALKIDGPGRVAVLFDDITDRKRAEAAVRTSEERFRGFVTASADIVYQMSPDWSEMRQLDGQGFLGDTPEPSEEWMSRYILPEDRDRVQEAIDQAIGTKSQFDLEHRVIRADGTPGWTKSRATPMLGADGEITEWLGTASDITQARGEREALRQGELRYRTLFEAIDSGFGVFEVIFDDDDRAIDYRFVEANPAFERQSGLIDAVGRRIREFAPDLEEHWFARYGHVALTGESMHIEGEAAPLGRWFDINAFRVGAPEQRRVAVLFTDITARRNAEIALRASEQQFETLLNQAPLGVYLVDSDLVIRQVNPVALPVFDSIAGGPVGRDFNEVIHILWDKEYADKFVRIFRHTLITGDPYIAPERAEYRVDRDVIEYYEWRLDQIVLPGGQYGVVCYFRDISAQVQARKEIEEQRELARQSEERYRALATVGSSSIYRMSPDWRQMRHLDGAGFVADMDQPTTDWIETYLPADERPRVEKAIERAIRTKDVFELEHRVVRVDGTVGWTFSRAIPLLDDAGEIVEWFGVASDVTARVKADQRFTRLFEASPAPFLVLAPDPAHFTIMEVNDAYLAATMRTREELVGRPLFDAFPDNPNEPTTAGVSSLRASLERVLATRQPDKLPGLKYDIPRPDGTFQERWWSPVNSPILGDNGEVEVIIHSATDVTKERRAERHQGLLLAELQHRVRNILTMVRSIARRTADNCEDVDDYVRHLDGRLAALARVQAILSRDPGRGVDLYDMVLDELESQATSPAHYQIEGPEVELSPKAAEVLSLAVHELATNSTKYGVLSESSGTIRIRWAIDDRDGRTWLRWTWYEPVCRATGRPTRTGFGTELISRRVPYELHGTGEIRIGDDQVEAIIDFPLANGESKPKTVKADKDMGQ